MAKSKSGGTRSYLRGRIASDVYSIGRDASGKKQQVVRSLAEQVKNPQTIAQMRGRMIMSTVMQAVSGLSLLIDHSFDNVPNGQPSISEFIRSNYALVKADVQEHPASGNEFDLNKYGEKGIRYGAYVVSAGKAVLPSVVSKFDSTFTGVLQFKVGANATTAGAIRAAIGVTEDDYFTLVGIIAPGVVNFFRVRVSSALADATEITSENLPQLFSIENPFGLTLTFQISSGNINIFDTENPPVSCGVIFSKAIEGGYEHNNCTLYPGALNENPADVVLPTYPVGEERFLNGGEL